MNTINLELLEEAKAVLAGKSRDYVSVAKKLSQLFIDFHGSEADIMTTLFLALKDRQQYLAQVTELQRRCTELLEENRSLKASPLMLIGPNSRVVPQAFGGGGASSGSATGTIGVSSVAFAASGGNGSSSATSEGDPSLPRNEYEALHKFQLLMLEKLKKNSHKGSWKTGHISQWLTRLKQEVAELEKEIWATAESGEIPNIDHWSHAVAKEAADVANFSMFIADVAGGL